MEEYDPFKPNDYEESKKRQHQIYMQSKQARTRRHDDDGSPVNRR